jgi:hypothetical protein
MGLDRVAAGISPRRLIHRIAVTAPSWYKLPANDSMQEAKVVNWKAFVARQLKKKRGPMQQARSDG